MKIVVGLGNPGPKYERTRHNIGFLAIDALVRRHRTGSPREKFQGQLIEGEIGVHKILYLKPMTFMNNSGISVAAAARMHKVPPSDVIVFHDELDLAPGKIRVKRGGGAAGHNGLRSIDAHFGQDYWRVRMGIGHPGERDQVLGYVLNNFTPEENLWLDPLLAAIAEAFPLMIAGQDSAFMSKVGVLLDPPKPKPTTA